MGKCFVKSYLQCIVNIYVLNEDLYDLTWTLHFSLLFPLTEKADENKESSEVMPDYSQLSVHSARTLTALADVNTKLYIGTEVNIPTNKINVKQHFT